jgi:hypothetical protein
MAFGVATAASAQDRAADALSKPWPSEAIYRG